MSQSWRFDPQHAQPSPARWAVLTRWWRGRWRSWQAIIRLLPVAGRVAVAATGLNLLIGLLPLGFVVGTSEAMGRVTGTGRGIRGGVLLAVGLGLASLLLQSVLSPFQAAFTELISRRVDGACARRLMRATLAEVPLGLLEQPDGLDRTGDARRGLVVLRHPGAAVAGLIALVARYAQLAGGAVITGMVLGPAAALVITAAALVARFGERGAQARYSLLRSRSAAARLQAAIAATHADAATAGETNWRQVHALYLILERIAPNPMVTLNRAVALAETQGPQAGLALLSALDSDERMTGHHRLLSVRAHLLEKAGDTAGAYEHYRRAGKATASIAEQRYLESRASRLRSHVLPQPHH